MHLSVQSFWCSIKILASLKKKKNSSQFCLPELWSLCPQLIKTTVLGLDSSSFCQCLVNASLRKAGIIIGFNSFVFFYQVSQSCANCVQSRNGCFIYIVQFCSCLLQEDQSGVSLLCHGRKQKCNVLFQVLSQRARKLLSQSPVYLQASNASHQSQWSHKFACF